MQETSSDVCNNVSFSKTSPFNEVSLHAVVGWRPRGAMRRRFDGTVPFIFGLVITTIGSAIGALDATSITNGVSGHGGGGAIATGAFMSELIVAAALSLPYVPRMIGRFTINRLFVACNLLTAVTWMCGGLVILLGANGLITLVVLGPVFGVLTGFLGVQTPIWAKATFSSEGMANAYARLSLIKGIAFAVGAGIGGVMISLPRGGLGIFTRGALALPLTYVAVRFPPENFPALANAPRAAWRGIRSTLSENSSLRRATLLGCGIAIAAAPMLSLIVPIADALRAQPLIAGASLIVIGASIGEMFAPVIVRTLSKRMANDRSASLVALVCGLVMLIFAAVSMFTSHRTELALWCVIGIAFGATKFAASALNVGAAVDENPSHVAQTLATYRFATSLVAPLGVMAWSLLLSKVSAFGAVLTGGVVLTLFASTPLIQSAKKQSRDGIESMVRE